MGDDCMLQRLDGEAAILGRCGSHHISVQTAIGLFCQKEFHKNE
jgi:hypothetical protein